MLSTRDSLQTKKHTQPESKGMEKRYFIKIQTNQQTKVRIAILIPGKIVFTAKAIRETTKGDPEVPLLNI